MGRRIGNVFGSFALSAWFAWRSVIAFWTFGNRWRARCRDAHEWLAYESGKCQQDTDVKRHDCHLLVSTLSVPNQQTCPPTPWPASPISSLFCFLVDRWSYGFAPA